MDGCYTSIDTGCCGLDGGGAEGTAGASLEDGHEVSTGAAECGLVACGAGAESPVGAPTRTKEVLASEDVGFAKDVAGLELRERVGLDRMGLATGENLTMPTGEREGTSTAGKGSSCAAERYVG